MFNLSSTENNDKDNQRYLFCQLNELEPSSNKWYECSRWVKFEEVVENTKEHWSKPHVGVLSLRSILTFKSMILHAVISLNHEGENIEDVIDLILRKAIDEKKLDFSQEEELKQLLSMCHLNPHHNKCGIGSQLSLFRSIVDNPNKKMKQNPSRKTLCENGNEEDGLLEYKFCSRFKKKIPLGSEVANILVAEIGFLSENLCLFIRLKQSSIIGAYTEVHLPTRFIIIILGTKGTLSNIHECGRVAGSLLVDSVFRKSAYKANETKDLIQAIDEFLDSALVIPPDEWNPNIKIDPPKEMIPDRLANNKDEPLHHEDDSISEKYKPTQEELEMELKITGRFFGGFVDDVKRKKKFYLSDFRDSLNLQCLASFIFLYFACLAPTITFGGLLVKATDGYLGAMESILAAAIVGVLYSLFSGQPLTILGTTGPLLVFESVVFKICGYYKWDFLPFRMWIGFWIMIFLLIIVASDLSMLVKYLTTFTEECFAMLISLIYIVKAFQNLFELLEDYPINRNWNPNYILNRSCSCIPPNKTILSKSLDEHTQRLLKFEKPPMLPGFENSNFSQLLYIDWNNITDGYFSWNTHNFKQMCVDYGGTWAGNTCGKLYVPDIFFFSSMLMIGTFTMAYGLKIFRNSDLLPCKVRETIGTFAVVIAIFMFTLIDFVIGMNTPKLIVPSKFEPTLGYSSRTWIVPILGKNPWWSTILAFIPAILAVILIFMDQQITVIIVNRKSNKLKKGYGYHLDMFIIAILIGVNSLIGVPWFVGSTVLAMNHVMSLKIESSNNVPGVAPVFLGCREQRMTHLMISLAIGFSVFFTPMLQRIPMPVLFGVFFYMGVSPLSEIDMIQRIGLFFINAKKRPDFKYLQYIPIKRVHLFTAIQVLCLLLLFTIKSINILSVSFPILVLAMCFVRKSLECFFSQEELKWLDRILPQNKSKNKKSKPCSSCCFKSKSQPELTLEIMSPEDKEKEDRP
uniref:Anion exchange protein n=1 Tax=Schmidtea mediterranea TaxID=79327 RepID=A0A0H3YJZ6_SCHMD|nr:slc4a-2 [Schmidtea mediterranea]